MAGRYIVILVCTENNCLPNRLFRNMEVAETLGFMAAVYEGFSEPPGIRMPVRGVGGQVIIETGGYGGGTPEMWTSTYARGATILSRSMVRLSDVSAFGTN